MNLSWSRHRQSPGVVADYCVICRDVQSHRVRHEVDKNRNPLPPVIVCESCGLRTAVNPSRYLSVAADPNTSLPSLISKTFPRLPVEILGRVRWERAAIQGTLAAPERQEAIREPFIVVSYLARPGPGVFAYFVSVSLLFIVGMMASAIVNMLVQEALQALRFNPNVIRGVCLAIMAGLLIAIVTIPAKIILRKRRNIGRPVVVPMLARSLRPLRPSIDELQTTIGWALAMRQPIGGMLSAEELSQAIARQPDRSLVHVDECEIVESAEQMIRELQAQQDPDSQQADQSEGDQSSADF